MELAVVSVALGAYALLGASLWWGTSRSGNGRSRRAGRGRSRSTLLRPAPPEPAPRLVGRPRVADLAELPTPGGRHGLAADYRVPVAMPRPSRWARVEWVVLPLAVLAAPVLIVVLVALTSGRERSLPPVAEAPPKPDAEVLGLVALVTGHPWWVAAFAAACFVAPFVLEALQHGLRVRRPAPQPSGDLPDRELDWRRWAGGRRPGPRVPGDEHDGGWEPGGGRPGAGISLRAQTGDERADDPCARTPRLRRPRGRDKA